MNKKEKIIDKNISFSNCTNKYGTKMFMPKEIRVKPDTSTSILIDIKDSKKMTPQIPEKEDLNIIYKNAFYNRWR